MAKSLLCVQNIAKIPARPKFMGRDTNSVMIITRKNTIAFETNIANKKVQFTVLQSNSTNDINIRQGNANVPTNVFNPFASELVMILRRPAMYLKIYNR